VIVEPAVAGDLVLLVFLILLLDAVGLAPTHNLLRDSCEINHGQSCPSVYDRPSQLIATSFVPCVRRSRNVSCGSRMVLWIEDGLEVPNTLVHAKKKDGLGHAGRHDFNLARPLTLWVAFEARG
jgi:hypothetical protein